MNAIFITIIILIFIAYFGYGILCDETLNDCDTLVCKQTWEKFINTLFAMAPLIVSVMAQDWPNGEHTIDLFAIALMACIVTSKTVIYDKKVPASFLTNFLIMLANSVIVCLFCLFANFIY